MKTDSVIKGGSGPAKPLEVLFSATLAGAAESLMQGAGHVVAAVVGLRRKIVRHPMSDTECERAGVPYESTEKAVYLFPFKGAPWWRFSARLHLEEGENCIDLCGLGCCVEVWYVPAGG